MRVRMGAYSGLARSSNSLGGFSRPISSVAMRRACGALCCGSICWWGVRRRGRRGCSHRRGRGSQRCLIAGPSLGDHHRLRRPSPPCCVQVLGPPVAFFPPGHALSRRVPTRPAVRSGGLNRGGDAGSLRVGCGHAGRRRQGTGTGHLPDDLRRQPRRRQRCRSVLFVASACPAPPPPARRSTAAALRQLRHRNRRQATAGRGLDLHSHSTIRGDQLRQAHIRQVQHRHHELVGARLALRAEADHPRCSARRRPRTSVPGASIDRMAIVPASSVAA